MTELVIFEVLAHVLIVVLLHLQGYHIQKL